MECLAITARHVLWLLNAVLLVVGVAVLAVSYTLLNASDAEGDFHRAFSPQWETQALLFTGVAIVSLALFGCVGTSKELSCATKTYGALLLLLVIVEVTVCSTVLGVLIGVESEDTLSGAPKVVVDCVYKLCCWSEVAQGCEDKVSNSTCKIVPATLTSPEACALSERNFEARAVEWVRNQLKPAAVALTVVIVLQCVAACLACCVVGATRTLGREVIYIVVEDQPSQEDPSMRRATAHERSRYRRLRSFFSRRRRSRQDVLHEPLLGSEPNAYEELPVAQPSS